LTKSEQVRNKHTTKYIELEEGERATALEELPPSEVMTLGMSKMVSQSEPDGESDAQLCLGRGLET